MPAHSSVTQPTILSPKIVFVTTCKGRLQHLKETLPRNLADNARYPNCKFVVLSYGDPAVQEYMKNVHELNMASGYLVSYAHRTDGTFHMAHAKNMAARCGILEGADILVTLDADNFTGPDFAQYIADNLTTGTYLCPNFALIQSLPWGPDRPGRGYYGRMAIRAQDFIKLGGYDEEFDTWRGEDTDLIARLKRSGYEMKYFENRNLNVIRHDAAVRFKEYPHAQEWEDKSKTDQMLRIIEGRTETVVNHGKVGVGTVYRNLEAVPIELPAIPTRVFGIGMHKTATTSLNEAFGIIGFDSWHFNNGNDARLIWEEMNAPSWTRTMYSSGVACRSKTLEQWYSLCDLPIPMLYRELDVWYPGSKFILTIRNEADWLRSVERMWDPEYNPHRWTWDVYPITNRLHTALYGKKDFDARIFLDRYRRHNADVIEYFKDRSGDLLVMDMDAGGGWDHLCGFLNVPIPDVPYPIRNQGTRMGSCPFDAGEVTNPTRYVPGRPPQDIPGKLEWPLCDCGKPLWHDGRCGDDSLCPAPAVPLLDSEIHNWAADQARIHANGDHPHSSQSPACQYFADKQFDYELTKPDIQPPMPELVRKKSCLDYLSGPIAWIRRVVAKPLKRITAWRNKAQAVDPGGGI